MTAASPDAHAGGQAPKVVNATVAAKRPRETSLRCGIQASPGTAVGLGAPAAKDKPVEEHGKAVPFGADALARPTRQAARIGGITSLQQRLGRDGFAPGRVQRGVRIRAPRNIKGRGHSGYTPSRRLYFAGVRR